METNSLPHQGTKNMEGLFYSIDNGILKNKYLSTQNFYSHLGKCLVYWLETRLGGYKDVLSHSLPFPTYPFVPLKSDTMCMNYLLEN